jgi:DHA1 family tetracycline resistance protein-like MFS transporter
MAIGNSLVTPALATLISAVVGPRDQGRVQGSSQALQSLGRIAGPAMGGSLYETVGHGAPYFAGAFQLVLAVAALVMSLPTLNAARAQAPKPAPAPIAAGK